MIDVYRPFRKPSWIGFMRKIGVQICKPYSILYKSCCHFDIDLGQETDEWRLESLIHSPHPHLPVERNPSVSWWHWNLKAKSTKGPSQIFSYQSFVYESVMPFISFHYTISYILSYHITSVEPVDADTFNAPLCPHELAWRSIAVWYEMGPLQCRARMLRVAGVSLYMSVLNWFTAPKILSHSSTSNLVNTLTLLSCVLPLGHLGFFCLDFENSFPN